MLDDSLTWPNFLVFIIFTAILGKPLSRWIKACVAAMLPSLDWRDLYNQGIKTGKAFKDPSGQVILPTKYLAEISDYPRGKLSLSEELKHKIPTEQLLAFGDYKVVYTFVHKYVSPRHHHYAARLQEVVHPMLASELGLPLNWKPVNLKALEKAVLAPIVNRTLFNFPNHNPEIEQSLSRYVDLLPMSILFLAKTPKRLKNVVARLAPPVRALQKEAWNIGHRIRYMVLDRLQEMKDPDFATKNDTIQWLISFAKGKATDAEYLSHWYLGTAAFSAAGLGPLLRNILLDLAAHPEYLQPLRDEMRKFMDVHNHSIPLPKLVGLDSFLKESLRHNPPTLFAMQRRCVTDISLRDGTVLPSGLTVAFARFDSDDESKALITDSEKFDGFRYLNLRNRLVDASPLEFTSNSLNRFSFGSSQVPCPGRFYVRDFIKTATTYIIWNYDLQLHAESKRPRPICFRYYLYPDPQAELDFRIHNREDEGGKL